MKKFLSVLICLIVLAGSIASISINAFADSAIIGLSSKSVKVGENVTVTLTYRATSTIKSLNGSLSFDSNILKYVSGGSSLSGSSVLLSKQTSSGNSEHFSIVFTALSEGSSSLLFTMNAEENKKTDDAAASATVDVLSGNDSKTGGITSISLSEGELTPAFDRNITDYTATVPYSVEKIRIDAKSTNDANVWGKGYYRILVGENKKTINVTVGGVATRYNINIKRLSKDETQKQQMIDDKSLAVTVDGVNYHISKNISNNNIFPSFELQTIKYNDTDINVITDNKKYTLYYLIADDNSLSDWFYAEDNELKKLNYIINNNSLYIVETPPKTVEDGSEWYYDKVQLGNNTVGAYKSRNENLKDILVLYCYVDGKSSFYRFDTITESLQRAPDFVIPTRAAEKSIGNIFSNFAYLPNSGKIIITLLICESICIIIFIIAILKNLILNYKQRKAIEKLENQTQEGN
ncbi:MAG: cadherin-like beta sandwich domain-containing protein [Clostridia bacterium]|nr:cadherin-like beta sandwich domain-containing protein [Clostridia bacterium]